MYQLDKYEATDNLDSKSYEESLRNAFTRAQDVEVTLRYRRSGIDTNG